MSSQEHGGFRDLGGFFQDQEEHHEVPRCNGRLRFVVDPLSRCYLLCLTFGMNAFTCLARALPAGPRDVPGSVICSKVVPSASATTDSPSSVCTSNTAIVGSTISSIATEVCFYSTDRT